MQIALTKKLSDAIGVKPAATDEAITPIFSWTANWTNAWDDSKEEDMLVLVNNATRFTVAIYEVKRKDIKNVEMMMKNAILHTLLSMNLNPELVNEYMRMAGEVAFVKNSSRQAAAWVARAGLECAFHVGREYNGTEKMYCDTVGASSNHLLVNYSGNSSEGFYPYQAMVDALTGLTGMQAYRCKAFELMVTLDLEVYKAQRRLIVPANMKFYEFHRVLQSVFGWQDCHLYDFAIFDDQMRKLVVRLVPFEEDLEYDEEAVLMEGLALSEFLPEYRQMIYTYDMGDNWEHEIQLVRVIEEYEKEVPYLLEAKGQTPPEDVGGVGGFVSFREIMLNPDDPEYEEMKAWAGFWKPELSEWESHPRAIRI